VLEARAIGGQAGTSSMIRNYPRSLDQLDKAAGGGGV
jgi:hypothetical protein